MQPYAESVTDADNWYVNVYLGRAIVGEFIYRAGFITRRAAERAVPSVLAFVADYAEYDIESLTPIIVSRVSV